MELPPALVGEYERHARLPPIVALVAVFACAAACGEPVAPPGLGPWSIQDTGLENTILDAAHGHGRFVVVGLEGLVAVSEDGTSWTRIQAGFDSHITGLTFSPHFGSFIAATHDDAGLGRTIATSPDGRTWTRRPTPRAEPLREVACADELCVAVGDEGVVLRSTDLIAWEDVSFTGGGFRWISVIAAAGLFVATGGREQVAHSRNGRSWTLTSLGMTPDMDPDCVPPAPRCNDVDDIAHTAGRFIAVTHPATGVWISEDLEHWERRETGLPRLPLEVRGLWAALSADRVVLVGGGGGKLAASYDHGESWHPVDSGFQDHDIWALAYGDGQILVAGESGRVATTRLP